jgi:hypothetical protein
MGSGVAACRLLEQLEAGDARHPVERVMALLTRAADAGEPHAQAALGRLHFEGKLIPRDPRAALRCFLAAAEAGHAQAQAWLGDVLLTGQDVLVDRETARRWYRKAAEQGHVGALLALSGQSAESSDEARDLFPLWLQAAEAGHPTARRVVGEFYARGVGVERSVHEGARWLRLACEDGVEAAALVLAALILRGETESGYPAEALDLLTRAATTGVDGSGADAEYNLGVCHRRGLLTPVDLDAAEHWYRRAAAKGQASAQLALADLLRERATSEAERAEAAHWYAAADAARLSLASA